MKSASSSLGTILTTSAGMTIYHLKTDPKNGTSCTGSCNGLWPPVRVSSSSATIASGMSGFGTFKLSGGSFQVTYNGEALYTYKGDTKPGQTNGQGSGGVWFAVMAGSSGGTSGGSTTTTTHSGWA